MNITDKDLEKFTQIACNCFQVIAPSLGVVERLEPVIQLGKLEFQDHTGFIDLEESSSRGKICLSMPREFSLRMLQVMGDKAEDEASLRDLVGELTSIISNNAKEHFGSSLKISVPFTRTGADAHSVYLAPVRFVLPLHYGEWSAHLVIALEESTGVATL